MRFTEKYIFAAHSLSDKVTHHSQTALRFALFIDLKMSTTPQLLKSEAGTVCICSP